MMLAGGIPATLQFVSILRRLTRRSELANVTMDSLSCSRSAARGNIHPADIDTCVLGRSSVSAVSGTSDVTPSLSTSAVLAVSVSDITSFNGVVLKLSEVVDPSMSESASVLLSRRRVASPTERGLYSRCVWAYPGGDVVVFGPCTSLRTQLNRPRAFRLSLMM